MTQEEKDLLLKDICARLPYGVKVITSVGGEIRNDKEQLNFAQLSLFESGYEDVKPYLFPLSTMTEEQYENFLLTNSKITLKGVICSTKGFEFLNKHHFDYRGLISMGLANDATGLNIY